MANKFKTEVRINDAENADIVLALSPEQSVILLSIVMVGRTANINLVTPAASNGHKAVEDPAAYAQ